MQINYHKYIFVLSICIFPLILCSFHVVSATLSPSDKLKSKKQGVIRKGPQDESVFERNLIESEPHANDILTNNAGYYKETGQRHFNGTVLGYVTAWNSHGYDVAKLFAKKFDIISPVWFQIVRANEKYIVAGTHDIDAGWMRDVRRKGKSANGAIKIVPRFIFDKFSLRDYTQLLSFENERAKVNEVIVNICLEHGFDGIVLEFWLELSNRVGDSYLFQLVIELSNALKKHNLLFYLVIPPYRMEYPNFFGAKHMDYLWTYVDGFSLMTYDFSSIQKPGANAPLEWVRSSVEHIVPSNAVDMKAKREKILMGLNMFGNDYTPEGGSSIVANQFLDLLKHVKKSLSYSERHVENFFEIKTKNGRHFVFYPTLHSINERIKLATELGCGISIWELGQGLDYFYDLF